MLIIIEKFAFDNNAMMKNYIPHEENMVARTAASYFMLSLTIHWITRILTVLLQDLYFKVLIWYQSTLNSND